MFIFILHTTKRQQKHAVTDNLSHFLVLATNNIINISSTTNSICWLQAVVCLLLNLSFSSFYRQYMDDC